MSIEGIISAMIANVALLVAIVALVYTAKTYLLKSGTNIRGSYTICSNVACGDKYVSNLTIENLKDRAVVVFKVYLKLGHSCFLEIDDFEDTPLILRPFEVFRKEYEPIDFYSGGTMRVLLNDLWEDKRAKKRLVLSTSDGRYIVKSHIRHWDPVIDFFRNYMTAVVRPIRSTYKGKSYGANARYIVEFIMENGREEVIPIYPGDYRTRKFRNFELTKECLGSREALEEFLYDRVSEGVLNCADIAVHEMEKWRTEVYQMEDMEVITASYDNWFVYHIVGRILTKVSDYRLRKKNKAAKQKRTANQQRT